MDGHAKMATFHSAVEYLTQLIFKPSWISIQRYSHICSSDWLCLLLVNRRLTIESYTGTVRVIAPERSTFLISLSPDMRLLLVFNTHLQSYQRYLTATRLRSPSTVLSANYLSKHQQLRLLILHHVQSKLTVSNMLPQYWNLF